MSTDQAMSDRDRELRRMLVATSSAEPSRPRRRSTVIASLAAFLVAGALTGGVVSAAALNVDDSPTTVSIEDMVELVVYDDAQLFGTPFVLSGQGNTTVELGSAPDGAEQLALAFHCVDAGTFRVLIDGEQQSEIGCAEEDTARTNGGGYHVVKGDGEHTLTIATDHAKRYVLWASWATRATAPEPSAAQAAALSDGVVTETEYRDGFDRYSSCMTDAGHPVLGIDTSGTIIDYFNDSSAVTSGVEGRCYEGEFSDLDIDWQMQNQDTSETANVVGGCLTAHGVAPEPTLEARWVQLEAIPLTVEQCFAEQ